MKAAICDDEPEFVKNIVKIIKKYGTDNNTTLDIDAYTDAAELMAKLKLGVRYDLLMLDICMPEFDGVDIGEYIRNETRDNLTQIVYISANEQYAMQLFKVRPVDFIIKPVDITKLYRTLDIVYELANADKDFLTYSRGHEVGKIELGKIIYISSMGRKVNIIADDKNIDFYGRLDDIYDGIKNRNFIRTHKSFIVNCNYIESVAPDYVTVRSSVKIPVSRNQRGEISKICQRYF